MQRYRVLTEVRLSFYDALVAQERINVTRSLVEISERAVETADLYLKRAEGNRVDLLQSRVEAGSVRILFENSQNDLTAAWRKLAAAVGVAEIRPSTLAGDLRASIPEIEFEESLERLRSESPEMARAEARVERESLNLRRACAERVPNLNVEASMQYDNATLDNMAGVQAGIPLPIWNRNQGGIRRARAELVAAESDVRRVELDLSRRLAAAFQRYQNAKQQVQTYERDILPDAKASLDLVNAGYREGEFGYLALLTSQRTFFQTNLSYLDALRELKRQHALIDGMLLGDSLTEAE
jgi:cobalt-zinc-cadmium efflux system outer membrane protein